MTLYKTIQCNTPYQRTLFQRRNDSKITLKDTKSQKSVDETVFEDFLKSNNKFTSLCSYS